MRKLFAFFVIACALGSAYGTATPVIQLQSANRMGGNAARLAPGSYIRARAAATPAAPMTPSNVVQTGGGARNQNSSASSPRRTFDMAPIENRMDEMEVRISDLEQGGSASGYSKDEVREMLGEKQYDLQSLPGNIGDVLSIQPGGVEWVDSVTDAVRDYVGAVLDSKSDAGHTHSFAWAPVHISMSPGWRMDSGRIVYSPSLKLMTIKASFGGGNDLRPGDIIGTINLAGVDTSEWSSHAGIGTVHIDTPDGFKTGTVIVRSNGRVQLYPPEASVSSAVYHINMTINLN